MKSQTILHLSKEDIKALKTASLIMFTIDRKILERESGTFWTWQDINALTDMVEHDDGEHAPCYLWGNQSNNAKLYGECIKMIAND